MAFLSQVVAPRGNEVIPADKEQFVSLSGALIDGIGHPRQPCGMMTNEAFP